MSKKRLLRPGNTKLGLAIWTFSIPAVYTCPGSSKLCRSLCYAARGFFTTGSVKKSLDDNLEATKSKDFVDLIVSQILEQDLKVVRWGVAGDIYSVPYAKKVLKIFKACKDTKFFIYSRSWRIARLRPYLVKMAKLKNVRMWWSVDEETGVPATKPKRVRLAYMQVRQDDLPKKRVDLFFRDRAAQTGVVKRIDGALVCPPENGVTATTCEKCAMCWSDPSDLPQKRTNRISLAVV